MHQKLRMKNFDFSEMWCLGFLLCHQRSCIAKRAFPQCCTGVQARGCHLTSCARRGHNIQQLGVAETRHSLSERLRFLRNLSNRSQKIALEKILNVLFLPVNQPSIPTERTSEFCFGDSSEFLSCSDIMAHY